LLQEVSPQAAKGPDTTITHKVYLDIGIAPTALRPAEERTLGDKSIIPVEDAAPVGRIVLGLYGNHVPITVANFLALVRGGSLLGTTFSRVLPGEYVQAGQQGALRMGQVEAPGDVQANPETSDPSAFRLTHGRPGTLSLSLGENDDDPRAKLRPGYKNLEFLITTGPGPAPRLDGSNIPFGRVLEGMGTISTITTVPTFRANERTNALNMLAQKLGDDRAAGVRRKYGRPLKAVVILGAGELPLEQGSG